MEWIADIHWGAVLQIVIIDILLGGDNAVVIALACRNLPAQQRARGIFFGTAGAIILRLVLVSFAVFLLEIPFLKLAGGLLLFWIGAKLMLPEEGAHKDVTAANQLWGAVKTIIIADFVMSLDNVIAIAGAAQMADASHQIWLVAFGLILSIPIIVWGSTLVLKLIDRFPIVITAGAALLGWIGGGLIVTDPVTDDWTSLDTPWAMYGAHLAGAILVVVAGWLWKRRMVSRRAAHE
ncbi:membrane protein [Robbsia andropogonis]|uniref:Membrane protein n=1 Tax=Robbsia andropogonis TaxID=28092 RepID=A0A0F5JY11_9BURK|nr:TerC family protein [Robbsia andropogonis]KKB62570.1 membrane protein [Robbsia andropogonis]MCP1118472.1 TerC family protein [Robbsia andropogonis]MCP1127748.1 TerC family protein [Robbsia andropogonis]